MRCSVSRSSLSGVIRCPASKSYTHRAVFMAALASGPCTVTNALRSADTDATIAACRSLGARIGDEGSTLLFEPSHLRSGEIDAANSGTTIRIASAVSALAEGTSMLTGDESLRRRPMQPLLEALEGLGARCSSNGGKPPVSVTGRISGRRARIHGNVSSQFISALLIAAPLTRGGMDISVEGELVSQPYLEATISAMERFGVTVRMITPYREYSVPPQAYRSTSFAIPADASSLALLLSAATLVGPDMNIRADLGSLPQRLVPRKPGRLPPMNIGADLGSLPQGDTDFFGMLNDLGARVRATGGSISVNSPDELGGGTFNLTNTPDLLPPLAILAARCTAPLRITGVGHARLKETDRIAVLAEELTKVGIRAEEGPDSLLLERRGDLAGAHLDPRGDHRLFMALCILAMAVGGCTVEDPDSAAVSYPAFLDDMRELGARIDSA